MQKTDEIKYIEEEIKRTISSIQHTHLQYMMNHEYARQEEEYPGHTQDWLKWRIKDLYYLILAYFEAKEMGQYLQTFKLKFDKSIINETNPLNEEHLDPEGELELAIISPRFLSLCLRSGFELHYMV